jgi:hypothetical protein
MDSNPPHPKLFSVSGYEENCGSRKTSETNADPPAATEDACFYPAVDPAVARLSLILEVTDSTSGQ